MFSPRFLLLAVVTTFGLLLTSSAEACAADGKVAGVIVLNGTPLADGTIALYADDQFVGAKLKAGGRFTINRVPTGRYKVAITGKGVPAKYGSDERTPLTVEVQEGENTFDFDLR